LLCKTLQRNVHENWRRWPESRVKRKTRRLRHRRTIIIFLRLLVYLKEGWINNWKNWVLTFLCILRPTTLSHNHCAHPQGELYRYFKKARRSFPFTKIIDPPQIEQSYNYTNITSPRSIHISVSSSVRSVYIIYCEQRYSSGAQYGNTYVRHYHSAFLETTLMPWSKSKPNFYHLGCILNI